ncbi:histone H2A-like isoform X2 [Cimex lectularius]|nr:histone H2A-like isoform X2 [Cimex lectularius]
MAGLTLSVTRCVKLMKHTMPVKRISPLAGVFIAGALEYLIKEVFDLAANIANLYGKVRVTPRHILLAIKNDEELDSLLAAVTIAQGGVAPLPNMIQKEITKRAKKKYAHLLMKNR